MEEHAIYWTWFNFNINLILHIFWGQFHLCYCIFKTIRAFSYIFVTPLIHKLDIFLQTVKLFDIHTVKDFWKDYQGLNVLLLSIRLHLISFSTLLFKPCREFNAYKLIHIFAVCAHCLPIPFSVLALLILYLLYF